MLLSYTTSILKCISLRQTSLSLCTVIRNSTEPLILALYCLCDQSSVVYCLPAVKWFRSLEYMFRIKERKIKQYLNICLVQQSFLDKIVTIDEKWIYCKNKMKRKKNIKIKNGFPHLNLRMFWVKIFFPVFEWIK